MLTAAEQAELTIRRRMAQRRIDHPLRYLTLWDHPTADSQRRALRLMCEPGNEGVLVCGGNGTGKSKILAAWAVCQALGGDHPDVVAFAGQNQVDPSALAPHGPGRVWVGSPSYAIACEQLRPHILALCPVGTHTKRWYDKIAEGELHLPGGGVIVSKAYSQFFAGDNGRQSWESAQIRAICFDEHMISRELLAAGLSRTRTTKRLGEEDAATRVYWIVGLTNLAGRDWFWKSYIEQPKPAVPLLEMDRRDNPYLDQRRQDALLAGYPDWQRAARERGALAVPQGQRFPQFARSSHVIPTFPIPATWRQRRAMADFGGRSPHCLWSADNPETGQMVIYREVAPRRPAPQNSLTNDEFAAMCLAAEKGDAVNGRVGDSKSHGNEEGLTAFRRAGLAIEGAAKGPRSRIDGMNELEKWLRTTEADGSRHAPALLIMDCCPVVIDEIEQLRWEPERASIPANERDTHPDDPDHGVDAIRYEIMRRKEPPRRSIFSTPMQ